MAFHTTPPLMYTRTNKLYSTDYLNDSYDYVTDELITECQLENYDQISGVSFIVICCFSFLGNGLLLYGLARFEDLKRVTMLFLLCLAIFDMLFTLTLPFWAVEHLQEWVFGDTACKILIGAYFLGMYGSLILLTAMTVDCFFYVVVRNRWFTRRRRLNCARAAFVGSWIISVGACLKEALSSTVNVRNFVRTCDTIQTEDDQASYYTQLILLFAVPLAIIILCYSKILHTFMSSPRRRTYKTLLVVLFIIMAFIICWGPYHIVMIVLSHHHENDCDKKRQLFRTFVTCRILAYFHCCINPLLFLIRGRSRTILSSLLFCKPHHSLNVPPDRGSDPSHFNMHQRSMTIPQNVTELKFI